jgi:4-hydroxybenzoyl-CoA reductase beta subunit
MFLPKFELISAGSADQAAKLLGSYGPAANLVAGGSDLFPRMKYRLTSPEVVITLRRAPVREPEIDSEGRFSLDTLSTLADISHDPVLRNAAPLLAQAAHAVGSNQIRHMATLGGNLCLDTRCLYYNQSHHYQFVEPCFKRNGDRCYLVPKGRKCWAVFMGDTAPALFCLRARVEVAAPDNSREISVEDLYTGDSLSPFTLSAFEVIRGVSIPMSSNPRGTAFVKHTLRGGLEFAIVNVAVVMDMEDDCETCAEARIAVGAVSAAPFRPKKAEAALVGNRISNDVFREVAAMAAQEIGLVMHHGFSVAYLRKCVEVCTRDALTGAFQRVARHGQGNT